MIITRVPPPPPPFGAAAGAAGCAVAVLAALALTLAASLRCTRTATRLATCSRHTSQVIRSVTRSGGENIPLRRGRAARSRHVLSQEALPGFLLLDMWDIAVVDTG